MTAGDYVSAPISRRAPTGKGFSLWQKEHFWEASPRRWGKHLKLAETVVLQWLTSMTVALGKESGDFYLREFLDGIGDLTVGVNMTERTLRTALAGLRSKGILVTQPARFGRTNYRINFEWRPDGDTVSLSIAKREMPQLRTIEGGNSARSCREVRQNLPEGPVGVAGNPGKYHRTYTSNELPVPTPVTVTASGGLAAPIRHRSRSSLRIDRSKAQTEIILPGTTTVEQAIRIAKAKNEEAQAKRRSGKPNKLQTLEAVWREAFVETFVRKDDVETGCTIYVGWKHSDFKKMSGFVRAWPGDDFGKLPEFLDFVVRNWRQIVSRRFAWMTKKRPPFTPEIGFVIAWRNEFLDAWTERRTLAWLDTLPGERRELEKLMADGMSFEAAALKVAEARVLKLDRAARAQHEARMAQMARILQAKERELKRRPWGPENVHPRAWENLPPPKVEPTHDYEQSTPVVAPELPAPDEIDWSKP